MSERPCHAVTISGFFWSAKFFQMRNAPSSGERGGDGEMRRGKKSQKRPVNVRESSQNIQTAVLPSCASGDVWSLNLCSCDQTESQHSNIDQLDMYDLFDLYSGPLKALRRRGL